MTDATFELDDEFKTLLPALTSDERAELTAEIKRNGGCRDKLVLWREQNILIDGYNRFEICSELDLPFETTEESFPGREAVKSWMIRNQLARRNLTDAARIELALMLEPEIKQLAAQRQAAAGGDRRSGAAKSLNQTLGEAINVNDEVGKLASVSGEQVRKYKTVKKNGTDATKAEVKAGTLSINAAHKATVKPVPAVVPAEIEDELEIEPAPVKEWPAPESTAIRRAYEAINVIKQIYPNDPRRAEALQLITGYMEANPGDASESEPDSEATEPNQLPTNGWGDVKGEHFEVSRNFVRKHPTGKSIIVSDLRRFATEITRLGASDEDSEVLVEDVDDSVGWVALQKSTIVKARKYAYRCPGSRLSVLADMRAAIKLIEGYEKKDREEREASLAAKKLAAAAPTDATVD